MQVEASLAETWDHYFYERGWPAWVEGFGSVGASKGYPEQGGTLSWRSSSAGRGTVQERVLEHEPRRLHRIAFTDPATEGELRTTFAIEGEGTEVSSKLEYKLLGKGPFDRIAGLFFVKGQVKNSLERSLEAFKHEVEEREKVSLV
ncbi:hypothetical protein BH10ACT11_BH10ACT11_22120 [soil metagenome]